MAQVTVQVPATTANCGPGFDAVGIACSLYNEVELTLSDGCETSVVIQGQGSMQIPCDDRNIVLQAVKMLFDHIKYPAQSINLVLTNHIPLARGLGSSAAAIVGGLVAANAITGNSLTRNNLLDLATRMEGHPDNVAPALLGGICLSIMDSSGTQCLTFEPPAELKLVVAVPDFTLSTKVSRQVLPQTVPLRDAVFNISRAALLAGALAKGELSFLRYALEDKIHQPYRQKLIPAMDEVFQLAKQSGALGATISGAGPALMAYTTEKAEAIGQAMVEAFATQGQKAIYHILSVDTHGAKIIQQNP